MALINSKQIKFTKDVEFLTASQIKNLAEGTLASDAVNKSQLTAAETAATDAVASEAALRAAADLAINAAAAVESAARIAGDSAEALRAAAAESLLGAAIDTEKGRVDAILSLSDADKNSFKEIVDLINSVDATNDSAFAGYVVSNNAALDAETSARSAADTAAALRATAGESISSGIRADLTAEAATARAAEAAEAATRAAEVSRIDSRDLATEVRIYNVEGSVSAEIANRISDVADEESRALAAEALLSGRITAEVSRATADVDSEETRALAAEGVLSASIASETANRITDVNAEETRATDAEGVLQSNISAEAASRIAADSALTSAYTSADSAITAAYTAADSAEASARSLADITLQGNINVEKGRVDAILLAASADTDTFAEVVTLISSIDTANDSAFAGYVLSNNAAVSMNAATAAAANASEVARATAAETLLQENIGSTQAMINSVNIDLITADAATLASANAYSDSIAQGLDIKQSVRVASTQFISSLSGLQTIDAVALVAGNRILVKNQTIASANGIYVVSGGAWIRSTDADTTAKVTAGMFTFVEEGAVNSDQGWVLQSNQPIVLGTTSLVFVQFSSAGVVGALNGLTKTGNNISLGGTLTGGTTSILGMSDPTLYLGTSASKLLTLSANVSNHYVNASYIANVSTGALSNTATGGFTNTSSGGHLNNTATVGNINLTALAGNLGHNSTGMTITTSNGTGAVYGSDYSAGFVDNSLVSKLYVTNQIAVEAATRLAADGALTTAVNVEKGRVDAILSATDADKDSFAEIVALINSVDTTNDTAFGSYVLENNAALNGEIANRVAAVNAEILRATAAETTESATRAAADIAETLRATAAEGAATVLITAEETRALSAESLLSGRINDEVANRIANVNTEEARAIAAEAILQASILAIADTTTASSGLTKTGVDVKLGGALTANTDITGAFDLSLGTPVSKISSLTLATTGSISSNASSITNTALLGAGIVNSATTGAIADSSMSRTITTTGLLGAVYGADYSATFVNNSLVSKKYVDDNTALATVSNKSMTASAAIASGQQIASGIIATPLLDSYVQVFINGLKVKVGDGSTLSDVYFASPLVLETPKAISAISVGDVLVRGSALGYATDATDVIDYDYAV